MRMLPVVAAFGVFVAGCDGDSGNNRNNRMDPGPMGFVSLSITDGPWHDASSLVLHVTHVEFGHVNGNILRMDFPGAPINFDLMQLHNGASLQFINRMAVPVGQYQWMRLGLDINQCHLDDAQTGGRHNLHMGQNSGNWLQANEPFQIMEGMHHEFMLDYDIRLGLHHQHMGGMGDRFELHQAMRCMNMANVGGLTGTIDPSLIDLNHPDCDPAPGGNWAYLFPGDAASPDDIADTDTDGVPGPIATDRVDMRIATGEYFYHFGHLNEGSYRVAFTCSGEWDESGDDDYPTDPDGRFDFQMFSDPVDVVAGEMQHHDLGPAWSK
ncbi:MAG: DUF4382 domain-containing protein [Woeseiaceae bacterium]|nr:DUF4382 domain-containing protein [Woeseiaceae bacterium]